MRIPGRKALAKVFRPIQSFLAPGSLVLGYHRVSDATWDPLNLAVSRENFRQHLDRIASDYQPISLDSLVSRKRHGKSLKGYVAVTFDDGYEDFIHCVVPELVCRNIPVTIFVTTGYPGRPFWWDEVSCLLEAAHRETDVLEIDFGSEGGKRIFEDLRNFDSAASAVREICAQMRDIGPSVQADVVAQARGKIAAEPAEACLPRALSQRQLEELSGNPLVEIAAHSVTHPMLSLLDEADQMREIQDSRSALEGLGNPIKGFSYPNGSYSPLTRDIVEKFGFDYACTSQQAVVRRRSDSHQLPRIWAPNMGGGQFDRWIAAWSGLRR